MVSLSVDGLVSGLNTTSLVSQLVAAEAAPQNRLKTRLSATQAAASAYRAVNSKVDAVRVAAEGLTASSLAAARTASSSRPGSVTATATASAVDGTAVSFSVRSLASARSVLSEARWSSPTAAATAPTEGTSDWPLTLTDATGAQHTIAGDGTLADVAAAVNALDVGVHATVVRTAADRYALQLRSTTTGLAGDFGVRSANPDPGLADNAFLTTQAAQDAEIDLGGGQLATSSSNTFTDLAPGLSVTVSEVDPTTPVTVTVGSDDAAVTAKVKSLVDTVNAALSSVAQNTASDGGSRAPLKGDYSVTRLSGELLDAVAAAVGTDGSPARIGLQLDRDGRVAFDGAAFGAALAADPDLAQRLVDGVAGRLVAVSKAASDSTTGSLVRLAEGRDSLAEDLQDRIADWDLRLAARKVALTRQFTAMETALSSLRSQSNWLAGQLAGLPSSS